MNIVTFSNRSVDPWDLKASDIDPRDIAHALALTCRFVGHTRWHYSVADHCLNARRLVEQWGGDVEVQLLALTHDAPEAYLGDVSSPTKQHLPDYKQAEHRAMAAIVEALGVKASGDRGAEWMVKRADIALLVTEAHLLLPSKVLEAYAIWKTEPVTGLIRRRLIAPVWRAERDYLHELARLREACAVRRRRLAAA